MLRRYFSVIICIIAACTGLYGSGVNADPAAQSPIARLAKSLTAAQVRKARYHLPAGSIVPGNLSPFYEKNGISGAVVIKEAVQTQDVFSPSPDFQPFITGNDQALDFEATNIEPQWTSNDQWIIYSSDRQSGVAGDPAGRYHLWAVSSNGVANPVNGSGKSAPIQLTYGSGNEYFPSISPSGNYLAFVSDSAVYAIQLNLNANIDAGTLLPLTSNYVGALPYSGSLGRPTWSADESKIVFSAAPTASPSVTHLFEVLLSAPLTGAASEPALLTSGPSSEIDAAWSPDGNYIAFSSNSGGFTFNGTEAVSTQAISGQEAIFALNPNASIPSSLSATGGQLTNSDNVDGGPAWASNQSASINQGVAGDLAFHRMTNGHYEVFIIAAENINTGAIYAEGTNPEGPNTFTLNTSDPTDAYNNMYPTWAPFDSHLEIANQSNRSITYNAPATGYPSETAISVSQGSDYLSGSFALAGQYQGILESQVLDINTPTILPSAGNAYVTFSPTVPSDPSGHQVPAGTPITFTVRLSDRESGLDDENIYVQVKNPTSLPENGSLEHKVFATPNSPGSYPTLWNAHQGEIYAMLGTPPAPYYYPGAIGGFDGTSPIAVGRYTGVAPHDLGGTVQVPGLDPHGFQGWGQEVECQYVSPHYTLPDSTTGNYGTPQYLAGIDDQTPGTAPANTPPQGWTQLTRLSTQDNNGGVLYSGTFTTPPVGSDFYVDVIGMDKAANWRIFDNIWGFTTKPWTGGHDILVVSDYALGQKWASTLQPEQFGDNLEPTFYGAESYFTDVDPNILPNAIYINTELSGGTPSIQMAAGNPNGAINLTVWPGQTENDLEWTAYPGASGYTVYRSGAKQVAYTDLAVANGAENEVSSKKTPFTAADDGDILQITGGTGWVIGAYQILTVTAGVATLNSNAASVANATAGAGDLDTPSGFAQLSGTVAMDHPIYYDEQPTGVTTPTPVTGDVYYYYVKANDSSVTSNTQAVLTNSTDQKQIGPEVFYYQDPIVDEVGDFGVEPGTRNDLPKNALGVQSYMSNLMLGNGGGQSMQYDIWRVLSRGAIPPEKLDAYAPQPDSQPAVQAQSSAGISAQPQATFYGANKCVVWVAPFSSRLVTGPGTFASLTTQNTLVKPFLNAGGRLYISGTDAASALDGLNSGQINLLDQLGVGTVFPNGGSDTLTLAGAAGNRISYDALFNIDPSDNIFPLRHMNYYQVTTVNNVPTYTYCPPSTPLSYLADDQNGTQIVAPSGFQQIRTDGQEDQFKYFNFELPNGDNYAGVNDGLEALPSTKSLITHGADIMYGGGNGAGLTYFEDLVNGSRVVFGGFGLEGLGWETYKYTSPVDKHDYYMVHNQRPNVMHNIVSYLRTTTVEGVITKPDGTYALNATVVLVSETGTTPPGMPESRTVYSATTGQDGSYTIEGIEPGNYFAYAYADGYQIVQSHDWYQLESDTTTTISLQLDLPALASISGEVETKASTGSPAAPVPGVTVKFTAPDGSYETAVTGNDGTYAFQNVPAGSAPGLPYNGTAELNDTIVTLKSNPLYVEAGGNYKNENFIMPPTGEISGLVTDVKNNELIGATVTLTQNGGTVATKTTTATGYDFTSLPGGTYDVQASDTGYETSGLVSVTVPNNEPVPAPTIVLTAEGVLGGAITLNGAPVGGVALSLENTTTDQAINLSPSTKTFKTGPDGFNLNYSQALQSGSYLLTATYKGAQVYSTNPLTPIKISVNTFTRVDFPLEAILSGLVTDSVTQSPAVGVNLTVKLANGSGPTIIIPPTTSSTPTNYLVNLPNGTYDVSLPTAGGFTAVAPATQQVTVQYPSLDAMANFTVTRATATISGTVIDSFTNEPIIDSMPIQLQDTTGTQIPVNNPKIITAAAGTGKFTATVPFGSWQLVAQGNTSYGASSAVPFTVGPGGSTTVDLSVSANASTVSGLITDSESGLPITGASVTLTGGGNTYGPVTTTTESGSTNYSIANVNETAPGKPYSVEVSAPGYTSGKASLAVVPPTSAKPATIENVQLTPLKANVFGEVVDSTTGNPIVATINFYTTAAATKAVTGETPVTSKSVTSVAPDGGVQNFTTVNSSDATKGVEPAGNWYAVVSAKNYITSAPVPVTITAGETTRIPTTSTASAFQLVPYHTFQGGKVWQLISSPYDLSTAVGGDGSFAKIFVDVGAITPPTHIWAYDPLTSKYIGNPTPPADGFHLGQGYWANLDKPVVVQTPSAPLAPGTTTSINLSAGWNIIGSTSPTSPVQLNSLMFTFAGQVPVNFVTAYQEGLVNNTVYGWNPAAGQYVNLTSGDSLQPWQGYWIFLNDGLTITLPNN